MTEPLPHGAEAVLAQAGIAAPFTAARLAGGMNNQVFRVAGADGRAVVLKSYFNDAEDTRDRLGAEYAFLQYAQSRDVACVPTPLAQDRSRRLGVYSLAEGRHTHAGDVTDAAISQALAFLHALNPGTGPAPDLPRASESCLSTDQHLDTVARRLSRLSDAVGGDPIAQDAARFLAHDVMPLWESLRAYVSAELNSAVVPVPVVSPSDFGFHNALIANTGAITFLDFEYAGWDDPAKLVGDAFHQVKVPIPLHFYERFRDAVAAWAPTPEQERRRYDILLPVYGVKWIVIMLNEFLPIGERRRAFAAHRTDRRAEQLTAARAKFARLSAEII